LFVKTDRLSRFEKGGVLRTLRGLGRSRVELWGFRRMQVQGKGEGEGEGGQGGTGWKRPACRQTENNDFVFKPSIQKNFS
jgi:hypothetical protein